MNQFQLELVRAGVNNAILKVDKARAVLTTYERKPDPLLIEVALDYLEAVVERHLRATQVLFDVDTDIKKEAPPMSKHKRLHSISGKGKFPKFAGFVGTHYGPPPKKKEPSGAANTEQLKAEHVDHAVSASHDIKD